MLVWSRKCIPFSDGFLRTGIDVGSVPEVTTCFQSSVEDLAVESVLVSTCGRDTGSYLLTNLEALVIRR